MKQLAEYFLIFIGIFAFHSPAQAQLVEKAEKLIQTAINEPHPDSLPTVSADTLTVEERHRQDSIRIQEMTLQLQEMRLNEIVLRTELDDAHNRNLATDSLKRAEQRRSIDSLRALTPGVPVLVDGDTLFTLYAKRGGHSALDRAASVNDIILKIGKDRKLHKDSVYTFDSEYYVDIMYGDKVIASITDQDALWQNTTRQELAQQYVPVIAEKIKELKEENSLLQIAKRAALFVLVLAIQYLLFRVTNYLFRKLRRQIIRLKQQRLKSIVIRDYEFLNKQEA